MHLHMREVLLQPALQVQIHTYSTCPARGRAAKPSCNLLCIHPLA